jgi:tripartite-type tricarboxylate transporter receptor subunit TctC
MNAFLKRLCCALALTLAPTLALAQAYPTRPITMIVPFAPGGPADVLGRLVGQKMAEDLGQPVVIENRPGANTIIGAQAVAKAKPDGYTLLLAIDGSLVMNPFLYEKLSYDPFKEFDPVALIALVPSAIVANNNVPATSLRAMIEIEKSKPGTFFVGVSTPTSQVAAGLLNQLAGVNITMVPYAGGTTQITDLIAGAIQLGHESLNVALPLYQEKQIKILALTGKKKTALAPELPLISESLPEFDLGIWQSVVVPAGTPRPIIDRLFASLQKAMVAPDVIEKLAASGIEPTMSKSPEEFGAFIKSQAETRQKIIKALGMKLG